MFTRDAHVAPPSRQSVVVVTGVGVGLLTLAFVLGIQVGKQTAALRASRSMASGEQLEALPEPLQKQIQTLEAQTPAPKPEPRKPTPPASTPPPSQEHRWTLQLLATTDASEAKRLAERSKAAGFPALVLTQKGQHKVRLQKAGTRDDVEDWAAKLRTKGFKPFPIKAD